MICYNLHQIPKTELTCVCVNEPHHISTVGRNLRQNYKYAPLASKLYYSKSKTFFPRLAEGTKRRKLTGISMEVPDFLPAYWSKVRQRPLGPSFEFSAKEAIHRQLDALQSNDTPYADHGVEVMYRFAGFDPFERSTYFGRKYDLGQFERFRRIFHHSSYRALLGHKERKILSSFQVNEHCFKQRIWIKGARPGEEETFEFTLQQRVGGNWDGYWLTESLIHDGDGLSGGIAY